MKLLIYVLLISCLLPSCQRSSDLLIEEEKAAQIFADITFADQIINLHGPEDRDSIRELLTQSLLKIHDLTPEELDTNLYLYMSDFDRFSDLTNLMIAKYDSITSNTPQSTPPKQK